MTIVLRSLALLRQAAATVICAICMLAVLALLAPHAPAAASRAANVPTASPLPPSPVPPTAEPPSPAPATAVPPPPTVPPTAVPHTAPPQPTAPARKPQRDEPPAATPEPPPATATPEPPAPTAAPPAEVLIAKGVDAAQRQRGETAVYSLRVSNRGGSLARDVVVSDDVPSALEIIDLKSSRGDIVASGQRVTAYPATLEPGEEVTLLIAVRVRADALAGALLNRASVTTSSPGDDPANNTATALLTVLVPAAARPSPVPAPLQSLPVTAEEALVPALPWWLPWVVLALGLMALGALLTHRLDPALRLAVASQPQPQPQPRLAQRARAEQAARAAAQPDDLCAAWLDGAPLAEIAALAQSEGSADATLVREEVLRAIDDDVDAVWEGLANQRLRQRVQREQTTPRSQGKGRQR